jgi:hypothetical protein
VQNGRESREGNRVGETVDEAREWKERGDGKGGWGVRREKDGDLRTVGRRH